ncbi:hypothetical protein DYQ86_03750 [Acidobacteria bacterium AB60]|nr:hypothetical protein DYQ86_03750 [Acidobacteria bacterium AB60]
MATTGIWNHPGYATSLASGAPASFDAVRPSSTDEGTTAAISGNDFLTLLVTEMKNQDPTANTDPTEYINQLVQVNSLQQLISINETLTKDLGGQDANSDLSLQKGQGTAAADIVSSKLAHPMEPAGGDHVSLPALSSVQSVRQSVHPQSQSVRPSL